MSLEQRDQDAAAVAVAPLVTLADINQNIADEKFIVQDTLTICTLTLRNGFKVVGTSAAASPENFNAQLGMKIAREKAVDQIWPLMGYALRERLYQEQAARHGDVSRGGAS